MPRVQSHRSPDAGMYILNVYIKPPDVSGARGCVRLCVHAGARVRAVLCAFVCW